MSQTVVNKVKDIHNLSLRSISELCYEKIIGLLR